MIHRTILGVLFAACIAAAAAAEGDVHWNGAGWYGVADEGDWGWIVSGPFQDQASCDAGLPADTAELEHYCQYLATKPGWD